MSEISQKKYKDYDDDEDFADYVEGKLRLVEELFMKYGAVPTDINALNRERFGQRVSYLYQGTYYRADCFGDPLLLCVEAEKNIELAKYGSMEDAALFPMDYTAERIEKEIRYVMEIEPYPENYHDE